MKIRTLNAFTCAFSCRKYSVFAQFHVLLHYQSAVHNTSITPSIKNWFIDYCSSKNKRQNGVEHRQAHFQSMSSNACCLPLHRLPPKTIPPPFPFFNGRPFIRVPPHPHPLLNPTAAWRWQGQEVIDDAVLLSGTTHTRTYYKKRRIVSKGSQH